MEGAEGLVVEGMKEALTECRRIYIKIHLPADHRRSFQSYGWSPVELMMELSEMGFEMHILESRGREIQMVGERTAA